MGEAGGQGRRGQEPLLGEAEHREDVGPQPVGLAAAVAGVGQVVLRARGPVVPELAPTRRGLGRRQPDDGVGPPRRHGATGPSPCGTSAATRAHPGCPPTRVHPCTAMPSAAQRSCISGVSATCIRLVRAYAVVRRTRLVELRVLEGMRRATCHPRRPGPPSRRRGEHGAQQLGDQHRPEHVGRDASSCPSEVSTRSGGMVRRCARARRPARPTHAARRRRRAPPRLRDVAAMHHQLAPGTSRRIPWPQGHPCRGRAPPGAPRHPPGQRRAVALPRPEPAPVTTAIRPRSAPAAGRPLPPATPNR